MGMPKYTKKEGFDHNPLFKASVFGNRLSFHSSFACNSSKQAQNEDLGCENKSQLLNDAHLKNFDAPFYSSTTETPSNAPQFKSTVIVDAHTFELNEAENVALMDNFQEGGKFYGKTRKSKKAAEANAAKVIYTFLNDVSRQIEIPPPILVIDESLKSTTDLNLTTDINLQHNIKKSDLSLYTRKIM